MSNTNLTTYLFNKNKKKKNDFCSRDLNTTISLPNASAVFLFTVSVL